MPSEKDFATASLPRLAPASRKQALFSLGAFLPEYDQGRLDAEQSNFESTFAKAASRSGEAGNASQ
jgi:hypothetical protein